MKQPQPSNTIDERIHDFIAKKSSSKHLGYVMADWFLGATQSKVRSTRGYERLSWSSSQLQR